MADERDPAALLREALRAGDGARVDTAALVDGTRRRTRARRRRRRAGQVLLAAAVVAVVPALGSLLPDSSTTTTRVATAPPEEPAPAPTVPATPTDEPPGPTAAPEDPADVAYDVPDLPGVAAVLGEDHALFSDLGQYAATAVVEGQMCNQGLTGNAEQVAGRWTTWLPEGDTSGARGVDVVVTGWVAGSGPAAFADVVEDSGECRWLDPQEPFALTAPAGGEDAWDEAWAARSRAPGAEVVSGVARTGDLLVGVTVRSPGEGGEADVAALLAAAVADLRAAGLPAAR
ncbi:hypothetical protein [Kineococcus sp. SYSU DK004]|uniref:hypothetical protein n=1 Tax=Kineococcus sp. SYSU DK004 TaxID=3383125 RepID=UPI003D7D7714